MKVKSICHTLGLSLALLFSPLTSPGQVKNTAEPAHGQLALQVRSEKSSYIPGEPITLKFSVLNRADTPIVLDGGADVWRGQLKVFIAQPGEGFKEYLGPQWGIKDVAGGSVTIVPRGVYETEAAILYNHRTETSHLSELYAAQASSERVGTEYAVAMPGRYRIKAVLHVAELNDPIESAPIRVIVEEPRGDDLRVWNEIKDDAAYGYFIQTGDIKAHPNSPKAKRVVEKLEHLVTSYPDSKYSAYIRPSLAKFRSAVTDLKKQGIVKQH
jgi:hypothetical protein